ncbi:uncharacterized protein LOC136096331 [Hydra vulgaris]|uniref:uncharacterized protein LOC136096331 n=1 Tax=Hydra vulgaris TaxID=6087 RepID=UPI0032EA56BE
MCLFCAKGRYDKNLFKKSAVQIQYAEKDHINELQNYVVKLQNQLSQYSTKADINNIRAELDQKCESLKKLKQKEFADIKKSSQKKELKNDKNIKKVTYAESSEEEEDEEEEDEKIKKPPKKQKKQNLDKNKSKIALCFASKNTEKKKKEKWNKKNLIELGYTRALKDVKNKKIPFKKNTSESDDE